MGMETPRRHGNRHGKRCACATAEACFACKRCLERHCVCGAAAQRHNRTALCRESRACNCRVLAPASTRCLLCLGCRQLPRDNDQNSPAHVASHCRCVAHQQQRQRQRLGGTGTGTADNKKMEEDSSACHCFDDTRLRATTLDPVRAKERRRTLARVKRRVGLPSSSGLYANKIVASGVGVDAFGEECVELSDDDDDDDVDSDAIIQPTGAEELIDAVPPMYIDRTVPVTDGHAPQAPLSWSRSQPFQQAMAARPTRHTRIGRYNLSKQERAMSYLTPEIVDRSIENAVYERDREEALPREDLVDYLILAASVKASRIPELIGSLDDTAATALGVVVEEYMTQLALRSSRESMCPTTKRSVQAFAAMVLHDFNYTAYLQQGGLAPSLAQLTKEQTSQVADDLARLVHDEIAALQRPSSGEEPSNRDQVLALVREQVVREMDDANKATLQASASDTPSGKVDITTSEKVKAVKLSRHVSKVTGQRVYKYHVAADVGGNHHAAVAIDGFESREAAEQSIQRMRRVLEEQDTRLTAIENPPPTVENPIITELYAQLLSQVRQARSAPASTEPSTSPSTVPAANPFNVAQDGDVGTEQTSPPHLRRVSKKRKTQQ